ncbi:MAG: hypothetical protein WCG80_00035 [Spirochaetales bacterium]
MKQTLSTFLFFFFFAGALSAFEARVGAVVSPPGTFAVDAVAEGGLELFDDSLKSELGLELGLAGMGYRALVPVGLAFETYLDGGWGWGLALHGLAGAGFSSGTTAFLWGGEAEVRTEFAWVPGLAVGLSAAVRYVGNAWEFPLHLLFELPFGPEDKLDFVLERDSSEEAGH